MILPDLCLRSSSASTEQYLPFSCKNLNSNETHQRFFSSNSSHNINSINLNTKVKNLYSQQSNSRKSLDKVDPTAKWISLHEETSLINKKFFMKNNEKKFPNDFFQNINNNKNMKEYKNNCVLSTRNSNLLRKNNSEAQPIKLIDPIIKTNRNYFDSIVSNRYSNYSKRSESLVNNYDFSIKDNYITNNLNRNIGKKGLSASKPVSLSIIHRLKPINFDKNYTQENISRIEDNEFLEGFEKKIINTEENYKGFSKGKTEEKEKKELLFTFYNNNCQNSNEISCKNEECKIDNKLILGETLNNNKYRKTSRFIKLRQGN